MSGLILNFIFTILISSSISSSEKVEKIRQNLLKDYDKMIPPKPQNGPIRLYLSLSLMHFSINEIEHTFNANAWIRMLWNDERLSWNSTETNISQPLRFGDHEIWQPDLQLYNNAFPNEIDHYGNTHLLVGSGGNVIWVPPGKFSALCNLNLIRWPSDEHVCTLKFGSWTHNGDEIDLILGESLKNLSSMTEEQKRKQTEDYFVKQLFISNSEWDLREISGERSVVIYDCCPEPYVDITFKFTVARRSPIYSVTIYLPIIVISIVNLMLFLLPPTSGEKITIGIINIFIVCIFLIFFLVHLPPLGNHLPLIVLLYACNLVMMGISLVISIIVLNLSRIRRISTPPQCIRLFCNANFASILGLSYIVPFVSQTHSRLEEGVEMQSPSDLDLDSNPPRRRTNGHIHHLEKDETLTQLVLDYDSPYMANAEWILVASMIDRLSFLVYSVVWGILLAMFI